MKLFIGRTTINYYYEAVVSKEEVHHDPSHVLQYTFLSYCLIENVQFLYFIVIENDNNNN